MSMVEMQHVRQLTDVDCGMACLAMVSGIPIERLAERFESERGMSKRELCDALRDIGVPHRVSLYNELNFGSAYIATVVSLNNPNGMHWVVLDFRCWRKLVYDPREGCEGKRFYSCFEDLHTWADLIQVTPKNIGEQA